LILDRVPVDDDPSRGTNLSQARKHVVLLRGGRLLLLPGRDGGRRHESSGPSRRRELPHFLGLDVLGERSVLAFELVHDAFYVLPDRGRDVLELCFDGAGSLNGRERMNICGQPIITVKASSFAPHGCFANFLQNSSYLLWVNFVQKCREPKFANLHVILKPPFL
jgi:hypothetical protein